MVEQNASDLHISVGVPPEFRIQGKMVKVKAEPMTPEDTKELCYSILTNQQKGELEQHLELDFSFALKDVARFRGNLFYQRDKTVAGVFRQIPLHIPEFEQLKLPPVLKQVIRRPNGLILVTGPTGSGKSTSLAAMLDVLNREEHGHIITIEDPVEFVHPHKNCVVNQREVGVDTRSFHDALKRILRQDPDFVLVGELRDAETIEMALTMAETGHLVFGNAPYQQRRPVGQPHDQRFPAAPAEPDPLAALVYAAGGGLAAADPPHRRERAGHGHGADDPDPRASAT